MRKRKQPSEIEPSNIFVCCDKQFNHSEFEGHLINDHKLTKEQFKGKKQMTMHIDGANYFSSTYQWEFESGIKFSQHVTMPRDMAKKETTNTPPLTDKAGAQDEQRDGR